MDFAIGSLAGMLASFITNSFDVVRTRMQLDGELSDKHRRKKVYRNIPHALYTIAKNDGILALQKGVVSSCLFQLVGNGIRLGIYQQIDDAGFLRDTNNVTIFWRASVVGAFSGGLGGFVGSPFLKIKTQLMSASAEQIAVGTQHRHAGTWSGLRSMYMRNGLVSLWAGATAQMLRNGVGSASQIATFAVCKDRLEMIPFLKSSSKYWSVFVASNIGAVSKTIAMNPFDVIVTRLYNQPLDDSGKGKLYTGILDCARKMYRTEGVLSFYKGVGPSYMRQCPQSVLLLMCWDVLKDIQNKYMKV